MTGGFLSGLLGIGGGIIYIIVLPYLLPQFGVTEAEMVQYTIANSIFGTLIASLSANYEFFKTKYIFPKQVLIVGSFGIAGSLIVQKMVVYTTWYSQELFAKVVIVILIAMLLRLLIKNKEVPEHEEQSKIWQLATAGFAGSFISALSGLGGGVLVIPILNSLCKINIRKASSISLGVIGITSLSMTIANVLQQTQNTIPYSTGYIVWPVVMVLSAGVILTTKYGVKTAHSLPAQTVKYLFSGFIFLVILKKISELFV